MCNVELSKVSHVYDAKLNRTYGKRIFIMNKNNWADIPFSPQKFPFFYGWVIVAVTTIGMVASIPGQTIGVSAFTDSLIAAYSLSRTQLSLAYMFGTLTSSFILPFAGSYIDRLGSRIFVVISSLGLAGGLCLLSCAPWFAKLLNNQTLVLIVAAVLFLIIRFFGQGCLTLVSRITVGKWFNHRRGLASGISSILVAAAFNGSPAMLNYLVVGVGWQQAYWLLALFMGLGMAAVGWTFYRDNPEQCGLVMDGVANFDSKKMSRSNLPETVKEFTRSEALRTKEFWIYAFVTGWQSFIMTAVSFHMTSIGEQFGIDREHSLSVFTPIAIVSACTVFIGGRLSDRIRLKWLLLVMVLGQIVLALGLFNFSADLFRNFFIAGYSISGALFGIMLTVVWPRYYGRKHLGSISGLTMSILVFASSIAPIAFSFLKDLTGSFKTVTIISIIIPVLCIIPALTVHNPQRKLAQAVTK